MTWRNKKYRHLIASMPCINCGLEGSTQAAHQNEGKGMGIKTSDATCIPLCFSCHNQLDQGAYMSREEKRALFWQLLGKTHIQMIEQGLLR